MAVAGLMFSAFKRYFLSGVLVVVPVIITFLVLRFLFQTVDGILGPYLGQFLGYYHIGLGVLVTLLIILLAGVLTHNLIGSELYRIADQLLGRVPFIRPIYAGSKQLLASLTSGEKGSFQQAAIIEYPRSGLYSLCLISQRIRLMIEDGEKEYCVCFIPSTPTPVTGMTVVVPADEVQVIDLSIEEAMKFFMSGGVVSPQVIKQGGFAPADGDKDHTL